VDKVDYLESLFLQPGDHLIDTPSPPVEPLQPLSGLCYISNHTAQDIDPDLILETAIKCDFPIYETRCPLSPRKICTHEDCPKKQFCIVGYCKFVNGKPTYEPLPALPTPIHELVCKGCAEPRGRCEENCTTYAEEHTGYWAYRWNRKERQFKEERVPEEYYNPFYHGYFSYKSWRKEQVDAKRKHRDWDTEQKQKKQATSTDSS
jgi:hypothetical protein